MNVFIFRRDLRLEDNLALSKIHDKSNVLPLFIFNKKQINRAKNPYHSANTVQFMIESLESLDSSLHISGSKLHCVYSEDDVTFLQKLSERHTIDSITFNADFTPFAKHPHNLLLCFRFRKFR